MSPAKTCWVIYDAGKVGTGNQCLGLAEGLGFKPRVFQITARFPWKYLPPRLWFNSLRGIVDHDNHFLSEPWPDLVISAGRATVAPVAALKRLAGDSVKTIQLLSPKMNPSNFDLVVSPAHDQYKGDNVIVTKGALHRVTDERLEAEALKFKESISHLPRPLVTVLIGGANRKYQMTPEVILDLKKILKTWVDSHGVGIAILPSRRTDSSIKSALQEAFKDLPAVIWDGESDNPYFGYLALADYIIVTSDSVSMTSEACFTGKPVYVLHLPGGSGLFTRFHNLFESQGYTRPLKGQLEHWSYPKPDELSYVIKQVKDKLSL